MNLGSFAGILLVAGACSCAHAAPADDYLTELTAAARARHLADAPEWLALLHYQRDVSGRGYTSEAISPAFFLDAGGRTDPAAELDATLASFFRPAAGGADDSTRCRFIARYRWLQQALQFDPARMPDAPCPAFQAWYAAVAPGTAVLVFTSAYLGNPSSMFGHTLLRFDPPGHEKPSPLESYALNFSATTPDTGLAYAYKGLTGRYAGTYSLEPYFKVVRTYSDVENRDIWEFALDFSPAEIQRMLEHVWELRDVRFPYYFISRNCSYALLALMDVARSDAALTRRFPLKAIPSDVAKAIVAAAGRGGATVYRPSLATRVRALVSRMPATDRDLVREVVDGALAADSPAITDLPPARQADIDDSAADLLIYEDYRGVRSHDAYAPIMRGILDARSALPIGGEAPLPAPDSDPLLGHDSSRADLSVGTLLGGAYQEAGLRFGYHDLSDPAAGFEEGAAVDMFGLGVRHSQSDGKTRLEYLDVARIVSLAPQDALMKPVSWEASLDWDRRWTAPAQRALVGDFGGGIGPSQRLGDAGLGFAFLKVTLLTGGGIPHGYAAGYGPEIGVVWHPTENWDLLLDLAVQRFPDHLGFTTIDYGLTQDFTLSRNLALRLSLSRQGPIRSASDTGELSLLAYF